MSEKPYHHGDLRTAMIEKGIEMINEGGLPALSLRKVAAACNVSHAAPYAHFSGKDDLLIAIDNHITEHFVKVLEDSAQASGDSPESLFRMGQAYILFFSRNPQYFAFFFSRTNAPIKLEPEPSNNYKPFELYKNLMLTLLDKVDYPKALQIDTLVANWAFVHGLAAFSVMFRKPYDDEWEQRIPSMLSSMRIVRPEERSNFDSAKERLL